MERRGSKVQQSYQSHSENLSIPKIDEHVYDVKCA